MNVKYVGYIINIDSGLLEKEALILIGSIENYQNQTKNSIFVVNPYNTKLDENTINIFKSKNINYIIMKEHIPEENKILSKIWITSYIETNFGNNFDFLIFLDNDTLFLNPLDKEILDDEIHSAFIRPVDFADDAIKNIDKMSPNWKFLVTKFNINIKTIEKIKTARDSTDIYPVFNSGFIIEKPNAKIFNTWLDIYYQIEADQKFHEIITSNKKYIHYLDQTLLLIALIKMGIDKVKILDLRYNFSLENFFLMRIINFNNCRLDKINIETDNLILIHYHKKINCDISKYFYRNDHLDFLKKYFPLNKNKLYKKIKSVIRSSLFMINLYLCKYKND